MTPALFQRTSSLVSCARNSSADFLTVVRSLRSRWRYTREPFEDGEEAVINSMAFVAFSSDRAAM